MAEGDVVDVLLAPPIRAEGYEEGQERGGAGGQRGLQRKARATVRQIPLASVSCALLVAHATLIRTALLNLYDDGLAG